MRFELQPEDKFIIIASDGVWEFLSNEAIAKIVWPAVLRQEQSGVSGKRHREGRCPEVARK